MQFISQSAQQTKKIAGKLAKEIIKKGPVKQAVVLALRGDLGSGKTTFLQGFALALGISEPITSPTFVIMKKFKISISDFHNFYHIDAYRLKSADDMEALGIKEIIANPQNIVAIEWPERIKKALPKNIIWLDFQFKDKNVRIINYGKNQKTT